MPLRQTCHLEVSLVPCSAMLGTPYRAICRYMLSNTNHRHTMHPSSILVCNCNTGYGSFGKILLLLVVSLFCLRLCDLLLFLLSHKAFSLGSSLTMAILAVYLACSGHLSESGVKFVNSTSGWTATQLFMWMPVAQMWTNFLNPENIKGLSYFTMLLAMIGNGLMLPRALFIRDLMWFTGSFCASFLYGWGNLLCMNCFKSISKEFPLAATFGLFAWIGIALWKDTKAYGYSSPFKSLKGLATGG